VGGDGGGDGDGRGRVAGFFIVEDLADGSAYWHLTAVSPTHQGRGWGRRLWASMIRRHAAAGRRSVRTTIAARNLAVVNLYAGLGWRFEDCQMTFHWMPEGGRPA
jgi:ribosomal protein S18 acetylase RimI-like enzyme